MGDRDLAEILESDDELPNCYDDDPEGRAYLDDYRFDVQSTDSSIDNRNDFNDYMSVDDEEDYASPLKPIEKVINKPDHELGSLHERIIGTRLPLTTPSYTEQSNKDMKLIKKGILSKEDIFCLKCVADLSADSTILWFINFLLQKDMQSNYKFLKSCLVNPVIFFDQAVMKEKVIARKLTVL